VWLRGSPACNNGQSPKDFSLATGSTFGLLELARYFRRHSKFGSAIRVFERYVSPVLALFMVVFIAGLFLIGEISKQVFEFRMNQAKHASNTLVSVTNDTITIDTSSIVRATKLRVEQGRRYHVHLTPYDGKNPDRKLETWNWRDATYAADPDGLLNPPWWLTLALPLKRHIDQPWFKVMAAIGSNHDFVIPIGKDNVFVAEHTGELMLYVNDALNFYDNNQGYAIVTIVCVDDETAIRPTVPVSKK
jgi:hypothetical protein